MHELITQYGEYLNNKIRQNAILEFAKEHTPEYYVWDEKEFIYYFRLLLRYLDENEPSIAKLLRDHISG